MMAIESIFDARARRPRHGFTHSLLFLTPAWCVRAKLHLIYDFLIATQNGAHRHRGELLIHIFSRHRVHNVFPYGARAQCEKDIVVLIHTQVVRWINSARILLDTDAMVKEARGRRPSVFFSR